MRFNWFSRIMVVFLALIISASTVKAWPHKRGQKVRVRFLATSTLIRGTFGQNEDTYLAQLLLPRQHEAVLVRLLDAYPNEAPPLSRDVLTSESGAVLRVRRDAECDRPFGEILLRTAPGDPMAVLLEHLTYRPEMSEVPDPNTKVQCYRIVRR